MDNVNELYNKIKELSVNPGNYMKPVRIYMDVDGVVIPLKAYNDQDRPSTALKEAEISVFPPYSFTSEMRRIRVAYNEFAAQKLSEWSHRDDVDFIWLTSWRVNAPNALDELFNIKSVGYLPWDLKMSDYNGSFKRIALMEEQEEYPSDFVWVDDTSNSTDRFDSPEELFTDFSHWNEEEQKSEYKLIVPSERYLNVTTNSYTGLTSEDADRVDAWLNSR